MGRCCRAVGADTAGHDALVNPSELLWDKAAPSSPVLLLAHGAGAPMDSEFMNTVAQALRQCDVSVVRFEFPYMRQRRRDGRKRPPDRQPVLLEAFRAAADAAGGLANIFIGGKSMGGRMATYLVADESSDSQVPCRGALCLGYPFHPPGKSEKTRLSHFSHLRTPVLICQGERDPFGRREEVALYDIPSSVTMHWLADGDHDLKPRKKSGVLWDENLRSAVEAMAKFIHRK